MENRETVIEKVTKYVDIHFDGNWKNAFDYYAHDTNLSRDELINVLKVASIGSMITRGTIADRIMSELDADKDGFITLIEFETGLKQ